MDLKPHSKAWYERLATLQEGCFYPWQSIVPPFNGEDIYLEWEEAKPMIAQVFRSYSNREGLELRFLRFMWQAIV